MKTRTTPTHQPTGSRKGTATRKGRTADTSYLDPTGFTDPPDPSYSSVPEAFMLRSLAGTSILAARIYASLEMAQTAEEEAALLEKAWEVQEQQAELVDAHAALAEQLDAEIAAVNARMERLVQLHEQEISRLQARREHLDATVLRMQEQGLIGPVVQGNQRSIKISLNPASCEIIDEDKIPEDYWAIRVIPAKEERKPDKKKAIAAWKQGTHVPGVQILRRPKVTYKLTGGLDS